MPRVRLRAGALASLLLALGCEGEPTINVLPGTGFFDPATLEFGSKALNTQYELTTRLTPDKTVLVTDVRLDPANDAYAARLASGATLRGAMITRGLPQDVTILFKPREVVGYDAKMLVVLEDQRAITLELKGSGRATSDAELDIVPPALSFGPLEVGREDSQVIELENVSVGDVTLDAVRLRQGRRSLTTGGVLFLTREGSTEPVVPTTLRPGQKLRTVLHYHPTAPGTIADEIQFVTTRSGDNSPLMDLSAIAVTAGDISCDQNILDFGTIPRGSSLDKQVTCQIIGGRYTLRDVVLNIGTPRLYEVLNKPLMPTAYVAGDSFSLSVRFSSEGLPASHPGNLNLTSGIGLTRVVGLEGQVSAPPNSQLKLVVSSSWDTADTDVDLHLVRSGEMPFDVLNDCFFRAKNPEWGQPRVHDDDPFLDSDDTDGFGPEVIDIVTPAELTYDVFVHYYTATAMPRPVTTASISVSSFGMPVATVSHSGLQCGDLWHAGTIRMDAGGPRFTPSSLVAARSDRAECN